MSLAYALTFFCDALLYYGALGCFGLLRFCRAGIYRVPLVLLAACWLSGRLTGRGKPWLRWLPMALLAPCLFLAENVVGRLASLPMLVYLPLYVLNNRRAPDYDYAADRFRHSLIVTGIALVMAVIFRAASWKQGLPYLFLYFTLNVTLLRLLRHDDRVARSRRFRILNLAGVTMVCGAGFALSQPGIVAAVRAAWQWFLEHVVLNLLALAAYAFQLVLYAIAWVMSKLFPGMGEGLGEMPQLNPGGEAQQLVPRTQQEIRMLPAWARFAIKAVGVALVVLVVFLVLRALSRRISRAETTAGTDERESLDAGAPREPRGPLLRRSPEDGVRRWYRKALALVRARGGRLSPTMNTLQIQRENADTVSPDAMGALREVYLPVRYGERPATREDVARAKAAYEQMRKG